ncbi:hypothetical protein OEZ85_013448 [Tetradesmus obliquus]|uniref:Uncharacterized protein n=1 Tax=Tetradesmus obliquus TaxID=3088 RepID=A0ABY8UR89_TETOB|nr:hypothetical protein OEZ85_013448 [Tetradesmus obliquus]
MAQQKQTSAASCSSQGSLPQQLQPRGSASPTIHPQRQTSPSNIPPRQTSPTNSPQRQTSSTNNSPQQQEDAVQLPALLDCSTLLHHPCMLSDAAPVCRLLCTSKAAAAAVADHLAGQLSLKVAAQPTESLELWLNRNSGLVRSLDISCNCSELRQLLHLASLLDKQSSTVSSLDISFELGPNNTEAVQPLSSLIAQHGRKLTGLSIDFEAAAAVEEHLAQALQQAAAATAQGAPGMQLCFFRSTRSAGGALLQQLPAASLTCLQLLQMHMQELFDPMELQMHMQELFDPMMLR